MRLCGIKEGRLGVYYTLLESPEWKFLPGRAELVFHLDDA
jgi:hypothetical protein